MKKSTLKKISNASLFREMKGSLLSYRKVFAEEARLNINKINESTPEEPKKKHYRVFSNMAKQSIPQNPKAKDYRVFLNMAKEAFQRQEFKKALSIIKKSLELFEMTSKSQNSFDRAKMYCLLGRILKENYQIQDSICYFRKSLRIFTNVLGSNNIHSPMIIFELADSYHQNYMPREAILSYQKFLIMEKREISKYEEIKIFVTIRMGIEYYYLQGPKMAINFLKKSLRLEKDYLKKHSKFYFTIIQKIGDFYSRLNEEEIAIGYFKKCLSLLNDVCCRKVVSKETIYNLLIKYYRVLEMPDRALELTLKALKYLKTLGKGKDLSIAYKYKTLAIIHSEKKDDEKVLYYFSKHLVLLEKVTHLKNSEFLYGLLDYFRILRGKFLCITALERLKNLPRDFKFVLKSNTLIRAEYKLLKGSIYGDLNATKKALKNIKEAKKLTIKLFGKHHPEYIRCCYFEGLSLFYKGSCDKALTVMHKALFKNQRINSYFNITSAMILHVIAKIYSYKGESSHSLEYFKEFLRILRELDLEHTFWCQIAYLNIADVYGQQGNLNSFSYFVQKSFNLKITDTFEREIYYCELCDVMAEYYYRYKNFKFARKAHINYLKIYSSLDICNQFQVISRYIKIANCDVYLKKYSELNQIYVLCRNLNRKLVEDGKIDGMNTNISNIFFIKACFYFYVSENYDESLNTLKTVLNLKSTSYKEYDKRLFHLYLMLARVYSKIEKYDISINYLILCLKLELRTSNSPITISDLYTYIGNVNIERSNIHEALKYYEKSLRIREKIYNEDNEELNKNYHSIAVIHIKQENLVIGLKYLSKVCKILKNFNDMNITKICFANTIGAVYMQIDQSLIHKALRIFRNCAYIARTKNFGEYLINTFTSNLVLVQSQIGRTWNSRVNISMFKCIIP